MAAAGEVPSSVAVAGSYQWTAYRPPGQFLSLIIWACCTGNWALVALVGNETSGATT